LDPAEALQLARVTARAEDTILVTGSLYTVAAVLRILRPTA
jgi:folylpolyglutamate synthase/dihydropteroate synthase